MRVTEKAAAVLILALSTWVVIMWAATSFQGYEANRMLRLELGSDAASLNQAVRGTATDGVAYNIQMVVRNTYMDYVLILLYWLTFVSLAVLAGRMGQRVLGVCAAILISGAALNDVLENGAILSTMRLRPFTDAVAVDISEFSQWKWTFFFRGVDIARTRGGLEPPRVNNSPRFRSAVYRQRRVRPAWHHALQGIARVFHVDDRHWPAGVCWRPGVDIVEDLPLAESA